MMFETIQLLLENNLAAVTGLPLYQKENTRITPGANEPWVRSTFLPARTFMQSIGITGTNTLHGMLQIDLFYPIDKGTATSNAMADLVIAAFPRGLQLSSLGMTVICELSWREAASRIEQYYSTPVVVKWRCHQ